MAKDKNKSGSADLSAKDHCFKVIEAIWSCKDNEQKKGCYNMLETYKQRHGDENVGVTFIEIELRRLEALIIKMEERQKRQQELLAKREEEVKKEANERAQKEKKEKDEKVISINSKQNKKQ